MDGCHYAFVQTHKYTTPRVNPKVNNGLWVITMCQCRFILGFLKKGNILVSIVDDGGGHACVGPGVYWKYLYLPLNFVVNLL